MKTITIDSAAAAAALDEIEHELFMMGFTDEEDALSDWEYYGPRIRRAVDELRRLIRTAAPAKSPETN